MDEKYKIVLTCEGGLWKGELLEWESWGLTPDAGEYSRVLECTGDSANKVLDIIMATTVNE